MKKLSEFISESWRELEPDSEHDRALAVIRNKAMAAYKKHGNIRNAEWRNANKEHDDYLRKHKLYIRNPD